MPYNIFRIPERLTRYQQFLWLQLTTRLMAEPLREEPLAVVPGRFIDEPAQSRVCFRCHEEQPTFAAYIAHVRRCRGRVPGAE